MTSKTTVDAARVELLLNELRLPGIKLMWANLAEQSDKEGWPAARFLSALAEHEMVDRGRRRMERHLAEARLPAGKTLATFDFDSVPMVSKAQVMALASGDAWLAKGANILLFGPPGGGKSHLSSALGLALIENGRRVSLLRPGKRPSGEEAARVLWHVIHRIRRHWPNVRILVRGDSHYCGPQVLALLRRLRCDYILGLAINPKLSALAEPWRAQCESRRKPSRQKVRRFHQFPYKARSWAVPENVIARVEATSLGRDARFIVTNLTGRAKHLYERVYCARGRMENLIKDMKLYTRSDKTACHRWQANQSCSCTWAPTGCCIRYDWRRRANRAGAGPRSRPSAASSSRSPAGSRN